MQPNKISLVSLVAGAVMFLLPWVEVQCKGRTFLRQTGVQAAVGAVSIAEEFTQGAKMQQPDGDKSLGIGFLIVASGAFTGVALLAAWRAVKNDYHEPEKIGRYAGIAAGLIGVQMLIGFPLEQGLREALKTGLDGKGKDPLEAAVQQQVAAVFQPKYMPALYLYLAALAVPALQWLTASRKERGNSEPAPFSP
jgi:hypothetical protein